MDVDRSPISQKMRITIASRQEFKCNVCKNLFTDAWQIDHTVALCDGGSDEESNMQALCCPCHKDKTAAEARARTTKIMRAAQMRVISKQIYDDIFSYDLKDDIIIEAEVALMAIRKFERGMDSAQLEKYLSLYGLGRQHASIVVLQSIFAQSFGIE